MNKTQLIAKLSQQTNTSLTQSKKHLDAFIAVVTESLHKGETIIIPGFGRFQVKPQAARKGTSPSTGETIYIPARNYPHFKAGKNLKDAVND